MLKSIIKGAVVVASLALATSAIAKDKIRVGISPEAYPPFTSLNAKNQWEGFEIDLLAALCKQMDADCKIVSIAWDGLIPALNGKKIDMIFNSMSITDERKKVIDFSDKYYNSPAEIIGGKDLPNVTVINNPDGKGGKIANPADLKGKTVGAQSGTLEVNGQHSSVQLTSALGLAHHARFLDVTEDGHVAHTRAHQRGDAVQRVATLEDLQVAGLEVERVYEGLIAVEHLGDAVVVLIRRRAQVRAVFEFTTRFCVLDGQGDGVVVGVEVPRKAVAFLRKIDDHVRQRIGMPWSRRR